MVDFKALKQQSLAGNGGIAKLNKELEKLNSKGFQKDERFWTPTQDKEGNGFAIIRFLPPHSTEEIPFIRMFDHGFKGPTGQWYIENSRTTIGEKDPVSDMNAKLWATGDKELQKIVSSRKRRLSFIANIQVIKDSGNKENEGKVKLYKFGKKIFDKVNDAMNPSEAEVAAGMAKAIDPFNMWTGAHFALKIRKVEGWTNYDKSVFLEPSALASDDELEKIYAQVVPLLPFHDLSNFKSYDELSEKLNKVLAESGDVRQAVSERLGTRPAPQAPAVQEPSVGGSVENSTAESAGDAGSDDPDMEYFRKLAGS